MTRQNVAVGSTPNDGSGDSLRSGGQKINANFSELYTAIGGNADTLPNKVIYHDQVLVTASGALNLANTYYRLNGASVIALTLGDGTDIGEMKVFTNQGSAATVTPTNFAGGTSFQLAANEGCMCIWDGTEWFIIGNQSVLTIA